MNYHLTLLTIMALSSSVAAGKESVIACPIEYPRSSVQLINPPDGWSTLMQFPLYLNDAGVMIGTFDQKGITKPEPIRKYKGGYDDHYPHLGGLPFGEKWVWCGYGGWNDLILAKPLAKETEQCIVTHRRHHGGNGFEVSRITCR